MSTENHCLVCDVVCAYDPEMDGTCSLEHRYQLACDEGFVTDAEHEQNIKEGWAA